VHGLCQQAAAGMPTGGSGPDHAGVATTQRAAAYDVIFNPASHRRTCGQKSGRAPVTGFRSE
jgi:hypothetical protein